MLNKEKEYLVNQVKELDKGSVLMDDCQVSSVFSVVNYVQDFQKRRIPIENTSLYCYTYSHSHLQVLRNQLLVLMKERDKGMARIEEKQCHDVKVESCARSSDERVGICFCCFLSLSSFICSFLSHMPAMLPTYLVKQRFFQLQRHF